MFKYHLNENSGQTPPKCNSDYGILWSDKFPSRLMQNQNVNMNAQKLNSHLLTYERRLLEQNMHFENCMACMKYQLTSCWR